MDKYEVREQLGIYIVERERIRMAKEKGIEYHTSHPALSRWRFTNVRRRDDKATKWFVETVYKDPRNVNPFITAAICRYLNWPPTVKYLLENDHLFFDHNTFDSDAVYDMVNLLQGWQDSGNKLITGAYVILLGHRPEGKVRDVVWTVKDTADCSEELFDALTENSLEYMAKVLAHQKGIGTFTAGQLVADFRLMPGILDKATDTYDWAPVGPGSQRGLNWVYGYDINNKWKQAEFNEALREVAKRWIIPNLEYLNPKDISLHSIQNCMCETSKLMKVLTGSGRPRAGYHTHENLY